MTLFSGPGIEQGVIKDLGMQTDLYATFSQLAGFEKSETVSDSFDLSGTLKHQKASPRSFVPFYSGSELRAFRLKDHKIHYITQGAYGLPPERKLHNSPMLIDLVTDIGETTDISEKDPTISAKIIQYANEFQQSMPVKPSILDSQFSE
jgi:arylsulfatase A